MQENLLEYRGKRPETENMREKMSRGVEQLKEPINTCPTGVSGIENREKNFK